MNKNELMDTLKRKGYHAFVEVPNSGRKEYLTILSRNFKLLHRFPLEDLGDDIEVYFPMTNIIVFPDIWKKYISHKVDVMESQIMPFVKFFEKMKSKWICNAYYGIVTGYENGSGGSYKVVDHNFMVNGRNMRTFFKYSHDYKYKLLMDFIIRSGYRMSYSGFKKHILSINELMDYLNKSRYFSMRYPDIDEFDLRYPHNQYYDYELNAYKPYLTTGVIFNYDDVTYICTSDLEYKSKSIDVKAIYSRHVTNKDIISKDFTMKIDCQVTFTEN